MLGISTRNFGRFWPFSWAINHRFGLPEQFPPLTYPRVHLRVGHQHSQFWPILAHFELLINVLGSRSNFHHWLTLGCIYVMVINTRYFGQFWTVSCAINHYFGFSEWFPLLTNPRVHSHPGHPHLRFSQFCPVSWAINLCFEVPKIFPRLTITGVQLRVGDQTRRFGRFWPISWAINHHFGFRRRFSPLTNPRVHLRPGHQHSQFRRILSRYMGY